MKSVIFIAFTAAGAAVSSVTALSFPRATEGQGFIAMPVRQVRPDYSDLDKRAAIEVTLKNQQFYYSTDSEYFPATSYSFERTDMIKKK